MVGIVVSIVQQKDMLVLIVAPMGDVQLYCPGIILSLPGIRWFLVLIITILITLNLTVLVDKNNNGRDTVHFLFLLFYLFVLPPLYRPLPPPSGKAEALPALLNS